MPGIFGISIPADEYSVRASRREMLAVFEWLKPKPGAHPLIRIGPDRDGAYLVPDDLDGIAACFSPGVADCKVFEDHLVDVYGIDCHLCDASADPERLQTPLRSGKQTFIRKWLDARTGDDRISLADWVAGHDPQGDLILQMDIEGAEYRAILAVPATLLSRFRIVVVELHRLDMMRSAGAIRRVLRPFFGRMAGLFTLVHVHPNNCCGDLAIAGTGIRVPRTIELTFHRSDRVAGATYPPQLPHPLDIDRNVPGNPPLVLGAEWMEGDRWLDVRV